MVAVRLSKTFANESRAQRGGAQEIANHRNCGKTRKKIDAAIWHSMLYIKPVNSRAADLPPN